MSNKVDKYLLIINFLKGRRFSLNNENQVLLDASEDEIQVLLKSLAMETDVYNYFTKTSSKGFQFTLTEGNLSGYKIYDTKKNFLKKITSYKKEENFIIYDYFENSCLGYIEGVTYEEENIEEYNFFFKNIFLFKTFLALWEEKGIEANDSNHSFRFIDYYNQQNQTFLLSTLDKRAEIKKSISFVDVTEDLSANLNLFIESFLNESKNQFPFFLKKEVIEESSKYNTDNALIQLFVNFNKIYNKTLLNFQIYIHDISIDKLKEEYEDFRKGYLEAFSEVTTKLLLKILSIPVAFGASAFALSKITSSYLVVLLLFGIVATSWIVNMSLVNHFLDLKDLSKGLNKKVKKIKEHMFFIENPDEKQDLREIVNHIKEKINLTIKYIWFYYLLTSILTVLLLAYPIKDYLKVFYNKNYQFPTSDLFYIIDIFFILCYLGYFIILSIKIYNRSRETWKIRKNISLD